MERIERITWVMGTEKSVSSENLAECLNDVIAKTNEIVERVNEITKEGEN